jgi:hypothetical protein
MKLLTAGRRTRLLALGSASAGAFLFLYHSNLSLAEPGPLSARFEQVVIPVGLGPASNAIADVNHDGNLDLLVLNTTSQTLTVLLGDGLGHFHPGPGPSCPTGPAPNDVAVSDFNGDGNLDVVIPNTGTPYLTILLGDGKGGFKAAPRSPFSTQSHPHVHGVVAADFDGDGKPDVVTDSWDHNQILMLNGDGAGSLILPGQLFDTGNRPYQRLRSADFNGDGKADVVTTDMDDNAVSILLGDGKGRLHDSPGSPFRAGVFPYAVAIDDMNKDGNPDLVVLPYDRDITDLKQLGVTVLLGDRKGGFRPMPGSPLPLAGCSGPERIATGDLDGDGFRDIAVTCGWNNKLMLYQGSKDGTFKVSTRDVKTGWTGLSIADLNGDGKDDILVSNNPVDSDPKSSGGTVTVLIAK